MPRGKPAGVPCIQLDGKLRCMLFGKPDRVPLEPGFGRKSTREAWHRQGLPAECEKYEDILDYAYEQAGLKVRLDRAQEGWFGVDTRMMPQFEEKVDSVSNPILSVEAKQRIKVRLLDLHKH